MRSYAWTVGLLSMIAIGCGGARTAQTASGSPFAAFPAGARAIDLTHTFDRTTIYWPTETEGFVLTSIYEGTTDAGFFYAANRFSSAEHGGTHMDSPIHFAEGKATAEAVPL